MRKLQKVNQTLITVANIFNLDVEEDDIIELLDVASESWLRKELEKL